MKNNKIEFAKLTKKQEEKRAEIAKIIEEFELPCLCIMPNEKKTQSIISRMSLMQIAFTLHNMDESNKQKHGSLMNAIAKIGMLKMVGEMDVMEEVDNDIEKMLKDIAKEMRGGGQDSDENFKNN